MSTHIEKSISRSSVEIILSVGVFSTPSHNSQSVAFSKSLQLFYEVRKAIKQMKNNKASGADGIPAEIFKSAEEKAHYGSSHSSRSLRMMKKFQMTSVMLQL